MKWFKGGFSTLWDRFKEFRVSDDLTVLNLWHAVRFLGLAPEVGASVHAWYVEDSYALQRRVAQVQRSATALAEARTVPCFLYTQLGKLAAANCWWEFVILTSMVRQSFSFLQEAEMVSEVANSKYHSLFFILKNSREQKSFRDKQNFFSRSCLSESSPAVEPLRVFLSHGVETMSDGGVLLTQTQMQSGRLWVYLLEK